MNAIVTRITKDKSYKVIPMMTLKKGDLFIMETTEGELTSVDTDGKFILEALNAPNNCYGVVSINAKYV